MIETLSHLVCTSRNVSLTEGDAKGSCIFCGRYSDNGSPAKLKTNFTGYQYLQSGSIICPFCYEIYNNQEYRKSMWYASKQRYKTFKRDEAKNILLNPPDPPYVIYMTKTWKKQGWLTLMNKVNYDRDNFFVGFDYDVILVNHNMLVKYIDLITMLLEKGISKTELQTGQLKPRSLKKIDMDIELMKEVQVLSGQALWTLCLYVCQKEKKKNG